MSKFAKGTWTTDENTVSLSMPFAKVNEAKRTVSGYATLDNIDSQDDVVLAEASKRAFDRARGNLREMHQPIAVGKVVSFREDEYFDSTSGELFRGIYVTARVSEGAEDTWKKVLDGTLTGFSIGGSINEASTEFVKEAGKAVRFIKDYDLVELSLVDNPANQLANVNSIQKSVFSINTSANGSKVVKGMVAETTIENVFICPADQTVLVNDSESASCPVCEQKMENAGWFEEGSDRAEKVRTIVAKFLSPSDKEAAPGEADSEGGVDMGTKKDGVDQAPPAKPVEDVNPSEGDDTADDKPSEDTAQETAGAAEVDETAGTEEEEATASPDEVEDDSDVIAKRIDELKETITESLEKSRTETSEKVSELEKKIEEIGKAFESKTSELESKFDEFGNKLEAAKGRLSEFEKALEVVNSSEAVKKSADLEQRAPETVQKSNTTWNGAFSVDNLLK